MSLLENKTITLPTTLLAPLSGRLESVKAALVLDWFFVAMDSMMLPCLDFKSPIEQLFCIVWLQLLLSLPSGLNSVLAVSHKAES